MKIINEKGKLFGIINIIDLTVLLVVGLILVGGAKRMKSKPIIVNDETKAIITYEVSEIRMVSVENIVVGDPIYHYDRGGYIGEIIETSYEPYREPVEFNGQWVDAEVPNKYVVTFKVKANVKNNPDVIIVGGEHTRIGTQYRLKNKRIAFFGTVVEMEVLD